MAVPSIWHNTEIGLVSSGIFTRWSSNKSTVGNPEAKKMFSSFISPTFSTLTFLPCAKWIKEEGLCSFYYQKCLFWVIHSVMMQLSWSKTKWISGGKKKKGHQNTLINDVWDFRNYTTSPFSGKDGSSLHSFPELWKKIGRPIFFFS